MTVTGHMHSDTENQNSITVSDKKLSTQREKGVTVIGGSNSHDIAPSHEDNDVVDKPLTVVVPSMSNNTCDLTNKA